MNNFQSYLSQLPQQIYSSTQFLRYYALPYMPNPQHHPSFQELFQPEWRENLFKRLEVALDDVKAAQMAESDIKEDPYLVKMYKTAVSLYF